MAGGPVRIVWDEAKIGFIAEGLPVAAHQVALLAAAMAASEAITSQLKWSSTGQLEADVRTPVEITPLSGEVGSDKVYARIEEEGGTIYPKGGGRLLIRGQVGPDGGWVGGARQVTGNTGLYATRRQDIVASADSVPHTGKHYLEAAEAVYQPAVIQAMIEGFPH